jgi:hypothetical protein
MLKAQTLAQIPSPRRRWAALEAALLRPFCQTQSESFTRPQRCRDGRKEPTFRVKGLQMAGRRTPFQKRRPNKLEATVQAQAQLDQRQLCCQRDRGGRTSTSPAGHCPNARWCHIHGKSIRWAASLVCEERPKDACATAFPWKAKLTANISSCRCHVDRCQLLTRCSWVRERRIWRVLSGPKCLYIFSHLQP